MPKALPKESARRLAYEGLHAANAARFPFPIEGRIPHFVGAEAAAKLLRELPEYQQAKTIKVNPDAPQLPVRAMALKDGKTLIMPSPRLRGGFIQIDPNRIPAGEERRAASLSHCGKYGREMSIEELVPSKGIRSIDLVVVGSVAVSPSGARAGKGEGYADLEYAILRELGHPEITVVTTVHPAQIMPDLKVDAHDLLLDYIVTPRNAIATHPSTQGESTLVTRSASSPVHRKPSGIDWALLTDEDIRDMPILAQLRKLQWERHTTPDLLAPNLRILFVGINPGRASATHGHNFAGPGNHFWRLLHDAQLTPVQYAPEDEARLLEHGIGITNVVSRATHGEADLTWDELVDGGKRLREKVQRLQPQVVALLGKAVYRAYAGLSRSAGVNWGLQTDDLSLQIVTGVRTFVAPNPSARSTVPYSTRLALFQELRELAGE